jgi:hypothetical protein
VGNSRGDVLEEHVDLLTPIDDELGLVPPVQLPPKYPQASQRFQPYRPIHDFPRSLILNHLQLLPNSLLEIEYAKVAESTGRIWNPVEESGRRWKRWNSLYTTSISFYVTSP